MFVVERLILNNKGELYHPCGTSYTTIIRDLKTPKGVINRINNFVGQSEVAQYKIYQTYDFHKYDQKPPIRVIDKNQNRA